MRDIWGLCRDYRVPLTSKLALPQIPLEAQTGSHEDYCLLKREHISSLRALEMFHAHLAPGFHVRLP